MIVWSPSYPGSEQAVRELVSATAYLHMTFKNEIWLWRGQADARFRLEPGMHTRVCASDEIEHTNESVDRATDYLITEARDEIPGAVFAIRKPRRQIAALDARSYSDTSEISIAPSLGSDLWWYQAPDISERLRIQRGPFILGALAGHDGTDTTLPIRTVPSNDKNWLEDRWRKRREPGQPAKATTQVASFVVRPGMKRFLRTLLAERSGLTTAAMFPTPWERPFLEEFARGYGRDRPIDMPPTSRRGEE